MGVAALSWSSKSTGETVQGSAALARFASYVGYCREEHALVGHATGYKSVNGQIELMELSDESLEAMCQGEPQAKAVLGSMEYVLLVGGNSSGDRWKALFFPRQDLFVAVSDSN